MTDNQTTAQVCVPVYTDETLEDLQRNGMRLIQPANGFRFGEDSVLLAALATEACQPGTKRIDVADLGAGCGAVSVLMAARHARFNFSALELDPHRFDCMQRNIRLNALSERMRAFNTDIKILQSKKHKNKWPEGLAAATYDMVVVNPPYRLPSESSNLKWLEGTAEERSNIMAAEEIAVSLEQMMAASALLLKPGGRLVMVHRPQRLPDIIEYMRNNKIEPITLQVMESLPAKAPSRIIITGRKGIRSGGFRWLNPLIVYSSPGVMSRRATELYGHEPSLTMLELQSGVKMQNLQWSSERLKKQNNEQ